MRICSLISHTAIGCGGLIGGWLVAVGQLGIMPSFAQAPAASSGQRSTELFNRVMDDVLGRRLTVRLTERDPGNGSAAHRHPGSHTVGYILEGSYEVKINDGPVQTLKSGEVFYEPPNALHAISRNASMEQPLKYLESKYPTRRNPPRSQSEATYRRGDRKATLEAFRTPGTGHMTASDLYAARQIISCQAGAIHT
jgi:quercetin dioxygenase-like cupin family protein